MTGLYDVNAIGAHLALAGLITAALAILGIFWLILGAIGEAVMDVARVMWPRLGCGWCRDDSGPCTCPRECASAWCCAKPLTSEEQAILRGERQP